MENTKIDVPLTWAYYDLYGQKKKLLKYAIRITTTKEYQACPVAQGFFNSSLGFLSTWTCNYADSTNLLNFQKNLKKIYCV